MKRGRSAPARELGAARVAVPKWARAARGLAGAVLVVLPCTAPAQELQNRQKLEDLERTIAEERKRADALDEKVERVAADAAEMSRALVALARKTQALERKTDALRKRIEGLDRNRHEKEKRLKAERARLARLLATLQRIARNPPEVLLAHASSPTDTLRSAMLLKSVVPHLQTKARELRTELADLARLGEETSQREAALTRAVAELAQRREEIERLLERKKALIRTTEADRERAAARAERFAAEARDLRELIETIERTRQPRPTPDRSAPGWRAKMALIPPQGGLGKIPPITGARGHLTVPVVGRIVARFGTTDPVGTRNQGLRFISTPGAQVVAPHDGHVVFAGPFRGYGRLLIIDHGEGYHTLLAGFGRIDVAVNQRLLAGEPIGSMARTGKEHPRLYLELRRNGRPVDPLPWLAATSTDKESG